MTKPIFIVRVPQYQGDSVIRPDALTKLREQIVAQLSGWHVLLLADNVSSPQFESYVVDKAEHMDIEKLQELINKSLCNV